MAKKDTIRFVADTNVIGLLALAAKSEKKFFYHYPTFSREVYEGLVWMNNMLNAGKIELVLPYVVFHELIKNKAEPLSVQKGMTAQQNANFEHKRYFKIIAKSYIRDMPHIKLAFMEGGLIKEYGQKVVALAKEYSEQAKHPEDIILSHTVKAKPFIMNGDFPCNDARIMAEATLMGFNLITFDKHFLHKNPFNIPQGIYKINKEKFNTAVRPVSFLKLIRAMKREGTEMPYLKRTFKNKSFPCFINFELLTHEEYGIRIEKVMKSKKAYVLGLEDISNLRTLFLKYMHTPLDVDRLQHSAEFLEEQQEEYIQTETQLSTKIESQKPLVEKTKILGASTTCASPKKKIKFDLSGGHDFDGLAKFLDKQKEDNQLDL